ncbi:MAG: hypothetical protein II826_06905 [Prevotella sp.]|nr:hypothetical protein [Prevotella sp.]
MKRIIALLLIVGSTLTTYAEPKPAPQKRPEFVIANLNTIISLYGQKEGQSYAVNRNPETGIVESSERIVAFSCKSSVASFECIAQNFMTDEPLGYQILHMVPGNPQSFKLNVVTNEGSKAIWLRKKSNEEMWLLCCKNPDNPQLRDAYAIVWEKGDFMSGNDIEGTIYMITSLRPDVYEKAVGTSKKTFKIEGRVDEQIKDSLYNIYIADTRDALYALSDDDYVACVPVVNKRFEFQTELDHPCVGRLRCIFPDGELCSAWIDLDFVPGETYRITVHNGYYDEDRDYERRVGRQSGRSLLVSNSPTMFEADTVAIDTIPGQDTLEDEMKRWEKTLTPQQHAMIELKAQNVQTAEDVLKGIYNQAEENSGAGTFYVDIVSEQIISQTKVLDSNIQDFAKDLMAYGMPSAGLMDLYKTILHSYSEQNKKLSALLIAAPGSKKVKKAQKLVQDLLEKYMKEATKVMDSDVAGTSKR